MSCSGLVMKSFHTTSMAIFTPASLACGITLRISCLRARVALVVVLRFRIAHLAGHQQHGVGAIELGVVDRRAQGRDPLGPHRRVGIRQANLPVDRVDHAVNLDARGVAGPGRFLAIDVAGAVELDALETRAT